MDKSCEFFKRTYNNGEVVISRCLRFNKNISPDGKDCEECEIKNKTIPDVTKPKGEELISRDELFKILHSMFAITGKELETINKRLEEIEGSNNGI